METILTKAEDQVILAVQEALGELDKFNFLQGPSKKEAVLNNKDWELSFQRQKNASSKMEEQIIAPEKRIDTQLTKNHSKTITQIQDSFGQSQGLANSTHQQNQLNGDQKLEEDPINLSQITDLFPKTLKQTISQWIDCDAEQTFGQITKEHRREKANEINKNAQQQHKEHILSIIPNPMFCIEYVNRPIEQVNANKAGLKKTYTTRYSVYGVNSDNICLGLKKVAIETVKSLQIFCDGQTNAFNQESVNLICKMTNLRILGVFCARGLAQDLVLELIYKLNDLEELVLNEFNNIDEKIVSALIKYLPKLRKVIFTIDYAKGLQTNVENMDFFQDLLINVGDEDLLFNMAHSLTKLQTLCINNIHSTQRWVQLIFSRQIVHEVIIYNQQYKNSEKDKVSIDAILMSLAKKNELTCLALNNVAFNQASLIAVLKNNPKLKTLVIEKCSNVKSRTIHILSQHCKNLEQLSLSRVNGVSGKYIGDLTQLKTLVLRGCCGIVDHEFSKSIRGLTKLECLDVNYNPDWLKDNIVYELKYLQNLRVINISNSKVTNKCLQFLYSLSKLVTLQCGQTDITANGFRRYQNWSIRKLNLSKNKTNNGSNEHFELFNIDQNADDLKQLAVYLPQLTHLNICGLVDIEEKPQMLFKKLKFIRFNLQNKNGTSEEKLFS